jgi:hypothetical protein
MAAAARDDDEQPLYKDASAPVEARLRDLLGRMTLREKAAQIERTVASPRALAELAAGSVQNGAGSTPRDRASPADWANMVDAMQRLALSSRLGITILFGTDAVHGHSNAYGANIFPHNVGLGVSRCRSIRPRPLIGVYLSPRSAIGVLVSCANRLYAVHLAGMWSSRVRLEKQRRSRSAPPASTGPSRPASP